MFDRVLRFIDSSIQADVYKILYFSEMSLPSADILSDLIVLTSPHERYTYTIPRIFEVALKATKLRNLVDGKGYF